MFPNYNHFESIIVKRKTDQSVSSGSEESVYWNYVEHDSFGLNIDLDHVNTAIDNILLPPEARLCRVTAYLRLFANSATVRIVGVHDANGNISYRSFRGTWSNTFTYGVTTFYALSNVCGGAGFDPYIYISNYYDVTGGNLLKACTEITHEGVAVKETYQFDGCYCIVEVLERSHIY